MWKQQLPSESQCRALLLLSFVLAAKPEVLGCCCCVFRYHCWGLEVHQSAVLLLLLLVRMLLEFPLGMLARHATSRQGGESAKEGANMHHCDSFLLGQEHWLLPWR